MAETNYIKLIENLFYDVEKEIKEEIEPINNEKQIIITIPELNLHFTQVANPERISFTFLSAHSNSDGKATVSVWGDSFNAYSILGLLVEVSQWDNMVRLSSLLPYINRYIADSRYEDQSDFRKKAEEAGLVFSPEELLVQKSPDQVFEFTYSGPRPVNKRKNLTQVSDLKLMEKFSELKTLNPQIINEVESIYPYFIEIMKRGLKPDFSQNVEALISLLNLYHLELSEQTAYNSLTPLELFGEEIYESELIKTIIDLVFEQKIAASVSNRVVRLIEAVINHETYLGNKKKIRKLFDLFHEFHLKYRAEGYEGWVSDTPLMYLPIESEQYVSPYVLINSLSNKSLFTKTMLPRKREIEDMVAAKLDGVYQNTGKNWLYYLAEETGGNVTKSSHQFLISTVSSIPPYANEEDRLFLEYAQQQIHNIPHYYVINEGHTFFHSGLLGVGGPNRNKVLKKLFREAENNVRKGYSLPNIGEGWLSESLLAAEIEEIFDDLEVVRHARPDFLGPQHFDIYLPGQKIAFEYQGKQHFEPVEFFGGKAAFKQNQERDIRKRELAKENGVLLIEVKEGYRLYEIMAIIAEDGRIPNLEKYWKKLSSIQEHSQRKKEEKGRRAKSRDTVLTLREERRLYEEEQRNKRYREHWNHYEMLLEKQKESHSGKYEALDVVLAYYPQMKLSSEDVLEMVMPVLNGLKTDWNRQIALIQPFLSELALLPEVNNQPLKYLLTGSNINFNEVEDENIRKNLIEFHNIRFFMYRMTMFLKRTKQFDYAMEFCDYITSLGADGSEEAGPLRNAQVFKAEIFKAKEKDKKRKSK